MKQQNAERSVALALSGGGARGLAHIGVIEALSEHGWHIDRVAGSSMGALIGAVYAMGKLGELKQWFLDMDRSKMFSLVDFTFSAQGLIKGDRVFDAMKSFIADANIEDLDIGFLAVATDIRNKKQYVFKEGSVYKAVRASIAIPTVFTPVKSSSALLVDGGILNNLPIDHLQVRDDQWLVASNVNANITPIKLRDTKQSDEQNSLYREKLAAFKSYIKELDWFNDDDEEDDAMNYFELINETIDLMVNNNVRINLERHQPDLLVELSRDMCGMFDFYRAGALIEAGHTAAGKALEAFDKKQSKH